MTSLPFNNQLLFNPFYFLPSNYFLLFALILIFALTIIVYQSSNKNIDLAIAIALIFTGALTYYSNLNNLILVIFASILSYYIWHLLFREKSLT